MNAGSGVNWARRAWVLAWITVAYNLVEAALSMRFGAGDDAVGLFGFGVDSLVEVASGMVVMGRLRHGFHAKAQEAERRATLIIAGLFMALALGIGVGALIQLVRGHHPSTTLPGLLISGASILTMGSLYAAKKRVAQALDSASLRSDAACTRACLNLSLVLFLGSGLFLLSPKLAWAEAVAALGLALLIGREGLETWRAARSPDFSGGCGCDHG